jgi:magnesium and cobalt transporter
MVQNVFNEFFNVKLQAEDVDTVAGLVVAGFTYLPEQLDEIDLHICDFFC